MSIYWLAEENGMLGGSMVSKVFLRQGESTFIRAGLKYRLPNPDNAGLEIIEVQLGKYVGEDDIVRFDDEYGRE